MSILEDVEGTCISNIASTEAELAALPWRAFIRRHRLRSELKRWRKALYAAQGKERISERRASIIGRIIGGILKG